MPTLPWVRDALFCVFSYYRATVKTVYLYVMLCNFLYFVSQKKGRLDKGSLPHFSASKRNKNARPGNKLEMPEKREENIK